MWKYILLVCFYRVLFHFSLLRKEVREILMRLQGKNFAKIFKRTLAKQKEMPRVRLLTDEQLKEVRNCYFCP